MSLRKSIVIVVGALLVCLSVLGQDASADRAKTLVLGRVSGDPVKTVPRLRALGEYLVLRLSHLGIEQFDVVVVRDNEEMANLLRRGEVDLLSETVMSAIQFEKHAGAVPMLHEWKKGVDYYRSIIVAHREGGVRSIDDLAGRVIGFEDPGSTSGFQVPYAMIQQRGMRLAKLSGPRAKAVDGQVGYAFSDAEINIAVWVARGIVDAGAISSNDLEDESRVPPQIRENLRVVAESPPILRSLMMVGGHVDAGRRAAIAEVLRAAHQDPDGMAMLKKYYKIGKYTALDKAALENLEAMRQLFRELEGMI